MQNVQELIGIIKGINYDGVINGLETRELQLWLTKNRNLVYDSEQRKIISLLDKILEDGVIDESERLYLLDNIPDYSTEDGLSYNALYELNGIIRGIVCDEIVNKDEVKNLKQWLKNNKKVETNNKYISLFDSVTKILEDNKVTKSEREILLAQLKRMLDKSEFDSKLTTLRTLAKNKKNFGMELINIIDDEEIIDYIHSRAEKNLTRILLTYSGTIIAGQEDIFISLALIALFKYDSNFFNYVQDTYKSVYDGTFPFQKIDGTIRSIINRYRTKKDPQDNTRIINTVLKQALVPQHYLPAFFEFIYDIYGLNFEYELPEDLNEEFEYILNGLKDSMDVSNDELKIGVTRKTYKLIKSTKMLILDNEYEGLIKLCIVIVCMIDKYYWDLPITVVNPYLKYGFENWSEKQQKEYKKHERKKSDLRSKWEVKYYLVDNKIYLITPNHKIKSDYDYKKICVEILNNDKVIIRDEHPDIRQIIGGYQLKDNNYLIDKPIGNITYRVMCDDQIIYSSSDKLYRDILIFNTEGNEISNNTDYDGSVFIVTDEECNKYRRIFSSESYRIYETFVKKEDVLIVGKQMLSFSSFVKPGLLGEIFENTYIENERVSMQVFKRVDYVVVECESSVTRLELIINDKRRKLDEFEIRIQEKPGSRRYTIHLDLTENGLYNLKVHHMRGQKIIEKNNFEFAIDTPLWDCVKTGEEYSVNVSSSFIEIHETVFTPEQFSYDLFSFEYNKDSYFYILPIEIAAYSIDGGKYISKETPIWIGDIKDNSAISILSHRPEQILMKNPDGDVLSKIDLKNVYNGKCAVIGELLSYKNSLDFVDLFYVSENLQMFSIRCYNRCVIDKTRTNFSFNPYSSELICEVYYYGKGDIFFELNIGDKIIENKSITHSGEVFVINDIDSFAKYSLSFFEKKKGLLTSNVKRMLYSSTKSFVSWKDLVGRSFRINRVSYDMCIGSKNVRKYLNFHTTYVTFTKQLSKDEFEAEIYVKLQSGRRIEYKEVKNITVGICSELIDNEVELYMEIEGDGLFLDFEHNCILDSTFELKATDIYSYFMDVREVINK